MKRSNAPVFWLMFGAGGMLSALLGTMAVFITGVLGPLGDPSILGYARIHALARNPLGKVALFVVVALFAWHAAHRIFHSLHDIGLPTAMPAKIACYGSAALLSGVVGVALLALGL